MLKSNKVSFAKQQLNLENVSIVFIVPILINGKIEAKQVK